MAAHHRAQHLLRLAAEEPAQRAARSSERRPGLGRGQRPGSGRGAAAQRGPGNGAAGIGHAAGGLSRGAGAARAGGDVVQADRARDRRPHRDGDVAAGAGAKAADDGDRGCGTERSGQLNCREAESLLGAYLDGELDLVRSLDVEAHARECGSCAASLRRLEAARAAVTANAPYYTAPAELRARIERRAAAHFGLVERPGPSSWWSGKWLMLAATCAALALVIWRVAPSPLRQPSGAI